MIRNWFLGLVIGCMCVCSAQAQLPDDAPSNHDVQSEPPPKRILGIVPNYRSSTSLEQYTPITPKEKFAIARQDSFDRGTVILGALLGGEAQLTNSTPSFGHGVPASAKYFAASFSDFVMGNYMTEAIFPTLLHKIPAIFGEKRENVWSRLGSTAGQVFSTRADSGEGKSTSQSLQRFDKRSDLKHVLSRQPQCIGCRTRLGVQISADIVGNVLKEFSPELSWLFSKKHGTKAP